MSSLRRLPRRRERGALLLFIGIALIPAAAAGRIDDGLAAPVVGRVSDSDGPVVGARVRWQGDHRLVLTDATGHFRLPAASGRVTAAKAGYRIASAIAARAPLELRLERLPSGDSEDYGWVRPHPDPAASNNCGNCHDAIYREWSGSGHAGAARNRKFLELFADPDGRSPPGWDLSRAHPLGMAVCATCHAPTLEAAEAEGDPRHARGAAADGIHCDFCHKIVAAPTDKLGVRYGRDGLALLRPAGGEPLFFGPLDDAVRPGESFSYLPLYRDSRVCASCHEGIVFGVHVYGTYSEWRASPARARGLHCQDCHMAPTGRFTNIAPGKGGVSRDPATLASHTFAGGTPEMLRHGIDVGVSTRRGTAAVTLDVTLTANGVGHRVPTGFIDRHLLLVVQAFDANGAPVPCSVGPRLPLPAGDLAGQPGHLYGVVLRDEQGRGPLPFWSPGSESEDTRLHPGRPDSKPFQFPAETTRVVVRLWYRRFWHEVARARGWTDNDVLVYRRTVAP